MSRAKIIYFSGEIPQGDPEGDQLFLFRKLHLLSKEKNHAVLASFLHSVTGAVKAECRCLEKAQRDLLPSYESILDLTDHVVELRKTVLGGAVERVLSLVFQLGSFIAYHESHPLEYDFTGANTSIIGRGPGLLSGAAVALSPSILMLPDIAADLTRITFRFGLVVDQVCRSLEVSPDEINAEGAWVYCAHGADEQDALKAVASFNAEKEYPESCKASVFNVDGKSVSIGGPPSTLKALFSESEFFKRTTNVPMRKVQGSWHNSRAYGVEHVEYIVSDLAPSNVPHLPLFSPVTGQPFQAVDAKSLFAEIMGEVLTQRIRWDRTIDGVSQRLKQHSPDELQLWSVQPSHYMQSVLERWQADLPSASLSNDNFMNKVLEAPVEQNSPKDSLASKLAVVGMSCRFPGGADDTEKFWELLAQGRDVHAPVPPDRFDVNTHVDPTGEKINTSKTPYGCFVDNPGLFDPFFFGMSPREAEQTDPMQRLALVTAHEALERAGYVLDRGIHRRRIGTFYGQASDDYREVNTGQDIGTHFISGGCRAFGPGRINYFNKFWGPSYSIDTACSSSLAAIQAACSALWSGDVDMAITGGMNILTNSDVYAGLSKGHFLSSTGGCKTWDEGADGYCRADGVGSVILKRLEDAEADNDNILAVILSAATDHSAEAVSITHPHDKAQAHLYQQVVKRAGIDPLAVSYVEMHGTGTQAGDPTEMRSVTTVFANGQPRKAPLHIGSVKSNVGHGEAAAGIMAFIKSMLVFQKGMLPPHIGIKTRLNPSLPDNLDKRGVVIPSELIRWDSNKQKRLAMVNNFGAAGGNTAMILEEATPRPRIGDDTRPVHPITVSAKTPSSLQENIKRLISYVESHQEVSIADLSYTTCARRSHYNHRVSILASSLPEAVALLQPHIEAAASQNPVSSTQPPVAFAFTGQGTFYIGIGAQLYRDSPFFRRQIHQLDGLTQRQQLPSFLPTVNGTCSSEDVPMITKHLAIVCVEIALAKLWASFGVKPSVVIGHSLGEYAALNVAGVLSDSAVIFLVGTRAMLLEEKCPAYTHGMLSVRTSVTNIAESVKDIPYEVACINGPQETVLGASVTNLDAIAAVLTAAGHKTFKLDVPHAYHTSQMDDTIEEFTRRSRAVVFKTPKIPIISPLHSDLVTSSIDATYLPTATQKTVDFEGSLATAWDRGALSEKTIWLEVGHHQSCCGFITRTLKTTRLALPTLRRDGDNWVTMGKSVCALYTAGVTIDWDEYHHPFEQALRLLDTPTYAWNNKNFWIQYRGDWNLTKGQTKPLGSGIVFRTSSIHEICQENYDSGEAHLVAKVDITDECLRDVVEGHAMNGFGVASSFLHADMAFTVAERIRNRVTLERGMTGINVSNFEYHEPVVKHHHPKEPQPILVSADMDMANGQVDVKWYNPAKDLTYCHASVSYEDSTSWLSTWSRSTKLVTSRIEALNQMAATGKADRLTTHLAYSLFGKLVDYSALYRTMQSVVLHEDEAVAEVIFPSDTAGTWTVPPHFIDGCVSLSGFILNGGTHFNNTDYFYITPAWKNMRFAEPLTPGGRYLAYVRMVQGDDPHAFVGDVYILKDSEIVGVVEAIVFRQWPRVMLNRFFRPMPETKGSAKNHAPRPEAVAAPKASRPAQKSTAFADSAAFNSRPVERPLTPAPTPPLPGSEGEGNKNGELLPNGTASSVQSRALELVAEELAVDVGMLKDDANISDFGLDSLMSLVLSQRLREELKIEIRDAFFLEVSTFGELKQILR